VSGSAAESVDERVAASRAACGLGPKVTDPAAIARIVAVLKGGGRHE